MVRVDDPKVHDTRPREPFRRGGELLRMESALALNAQWVKYAARVDGRDKLCRSVSYGSDFVIWLMKLSGQDAITRWVKQVSNVKSGVGVARKCFRLAAPLKDIDAVANLKEVGVQAKMKMVLHTFNAIYYFIDHIELGCIFQIFPYKPADMKRLRYKFWVIKTVMNISLALMAFQKAGKALHAALKELKGSPQDPEHKASASKCKEALWKAKLQLVVALTDIPIAFFNTSDWGKNAVKAQWMGLSGAIGSLISAHLIWKEVGQGMKKQIKAN
jgi:hypothetical protein